MTESEILNFVVLDVNEMGQTHLNEIPAHLVISDELGELLVQRDCALCRERLLSKVLHNLETRLKDLLPVNLHHVLLERLFVSDLFNHLPVL